MRTNMNKLLVILLVSIVVFSPILYLNTSQVIAGRDICETWHDLYLDCLPPAQDCLCTVVKTGIVIEW